MKKDMVTGIGAIILGLLYTFKALSLPKASIGNPMAPLYFPLSLGVLMILMGVIVIVVEKNKKIISENKKEEEKEKGYLKLIIGTIIASLVYTIIFDKIGFIISTILFLGFILFMVNGRENWQTNIMVTVIFTIGIWYIFEKLINISLP
ncbi:MAG: tripartite tricarboxylate transporter TctB family protein [Thermovenabulum sp.]|uniref:tripartite tricarboxylate transporter TctB family protein n=1 Tax=Thermovenabulum sp. TaxID=3100335 RepID=UPI003C7E964D